MGYGATHDFEQNDKNLLIKLDPTDSSELWLIQLPLNQPFDFNGQEVTLKLHHDGHLGTLESVSGKSYDVTSFASQHPDATVFSSSGSKSKIVGKISRRVSLVHYPEPDELQKQSSNNLKQMHERSATLTNSSQRFATPSQSTRTRHWQSGSGLSSSHGKGSLFASEGQAKAPKRKHLDERTRSEMKQAQSSNRNLAPSSGSVGRTFRREKIKEAK